jgi:hypothetical protein
MKKQRFVFAVFLTFAFCTVALPAFAKDKEKCNGQDQSEAKHGKQHKKSEPNPEKEMRFRELDRNNNGIITRDEWRGDNRSFVKHDGNRDGVLSGDEVRPDGRGSDEVVSGERPMGRFNDQDHNNDGVISRDEWHGDNPTFDRMDSSRDGVLSRDEFFARGDDQQFSFHELDQNRDGMVARSEWSSDARLFERRDTDRDGMLSPAEFFHRP